MKFKSLLVLAVMFISIFVLSGCGQTKCEYTKINEENEISEWKELYPLKNPRENPISFLLNDRYIFLIGGRKNLFNNNYDYYDFSLIMENKMSFWKNFSIKKTENNRLLFISKGSGIVEANNKIFVLGGYINNSDLKKYYKNRNFMAWKINFGNLKNKIIEKIEKFKENEFPKYKDGFSFYGQQKFMLCDGYYVNITIGGKCECIPQWIFNED